MKQDLSVFFTFCSKMWTYWLFVSFSVYFFSRTVILRYSVEFVRFTCHDLIHRFLILSSLFQEIYTETLVISKNRNIKPCMQQN
jgi:hypothetical protein